MRPGGSSEQGQRIKYGDVFAVAGDLAAQPIAPQDAALMQTAENAVLGHTRKGGPAAVMQSAAARNERAGIVAHDRASDIPRHHRGRNPRARRPYRHRIRRRTGRSLKTRTVL